MIRADEDALICDFAETYHIFDYKRLPLQTVAIFAIGLPEHSRIKRKLSGQKVSMEKMLLAAIHDQLNILIWFQTKDGQKGQNKPKLLTEALMGEDNNHKGIAFDSGKAFEETRQKLIGKITGGNDGQ